MNMVDVLGLSFFMYLLFGLTALLWGMASDRWGARLLLILFFLGAGSSGIVVALLLDSPSGFKIALASLGFFSGIYHPAGLGLISKEVKNVSMGMSYNGMFGNLGLAAAPLFTGLINWVWGSESSIFTSRRNEFLWCILYDFISLAGDRALQKNKTG